MKVAVTGASGLVGSALANLLSQMGDEVYPIVRRPASTPLEISWDPALGKIDGERLESVDAVVHLAGENIGQRWTTTVKEKLRASRLDGTRLLCETIARLDRPPRVVCCASAIGYYGNRGDEILVESSAPGKGFLADLCVEWEAQSKLLERLPIRIARLRFGVVLSPKGGVLAKMLPIFRLGLGGVVGSGRQYFSWISIDDAAAAIRHCLTHRNCYGPVNLTAPEPVTNREFTRILGRTVRRPAVCWVPATAARLAMGEMADELLLASQRVAPRKLEQQGFTFKHVQLEIALGELLATDRPA